MTKQECIQIMAMLGAFYSGGKNDPQMQAEAWFLILGKYDYRMAEQAVLHFAENDTRDYATFPTVGKIVEQIKEEIRVFERPINQILNAISYGRSYNELSVNAMKVISREQYDEWLNLDAEYFSDHYNEFRQVLTNQRLLTDGQV